MYNQITKELKQHSNANKAVILLRFFKTGKDEYGEGDRFVGVTVPIIRSIVKKFYEQINFADIQKLLDSPIHEYRLTGLLTLVYKYKKSDIQDKKKIVQFYEKNFQAINNWDLVDLTAHKISQIRLDLLKSHLQKIP